MDKYRMLRDEEIIAIKKADTDRLVRCIQYLNQVKAKHENFLAWADAKILNKDEHMDALLTEYQEHKDAQQELIQLVFWLSCLPRE